MYQESLFYWNSSFAGQFWQYVPISTVLQKWDKQICLIYNMYKLFSNAICYKHVYTPLLSTGIPGRYFYLLGNLGSFESIQQPFYIFLCLAMKFKCYPFLFVSHSILLLSFHGSDLRSIWLLQQSYDP